MVSLRASETGSGAEAALSVPVPHAVESGNVRARPFPSRDQECGAVAAAGRRWLTLGLVRREDDGRRGREVVGRGHGGGRRRRWGAGRAEEWRRSGSESARIRPSTESVAPALRAKFARGR